MLSDAYEAAVRHLSEVYSQHTISDAKDYQIDSCASELHLVVGGVAIAYSKSSTNHLIPISILRRGSLFGGNTLMHVEGTFLKILTSLDVILLPKSEANGSRMAALCCSWAQEQSLIQAQSFIQVFGESNLTVRFYRLFKLLATEIGVLRAADPHLRHLTAPLDLDTLAMLSLTSASTSSRRINDMINDGLIVKVKRSHYAVSLKLITTKL